MAIPDLDWVQKHFDDLRKLGFSEEKIESIKTEDNTTEAPSYDMSRFSVYIWETVIDPLTPSGWLNNTLKKLRNEEQDKNHSALYIADERPHEWDTLKDAVESLIKSGVDEKSLFTLIRSCQKDVLLQVICLIEQGDAGSMHESDVTCDGSTPPRKFWDLGSDILNFDPVNIKENNKD